MRETRTTSARQMAAGLRRSRHLRNRLRTSLCASALRLPPLPSQRFPAFPALLQSVSATGYPLFSVLSSLVTVPDLYHQKCSTFRDESRQPRTKGDNWFELETASLGGHDPQARGVQVHRSSYLLRGRILLGQRFLSLTRVLRLQELPLRR